MKTYFNITKGRIRVFLGNSTIEIYWPHFKKGNDFVGVFAKSTFIIYFPNEYRPSWRRSISLMLLGFGVGWAYKHWDNPNVEVTNQGLKEA